MCECIAIVHTTKSVNLMQKNVAHDCLKIVYAKLLLPLLLHNRMCVLCIACAKCKHCCSNQTLVLTPHGSQWFIVAIY